MGDEADDELLLIGFLSKNSKILTIPMIPALERIRELCHIRWRRDSSGYFAYNFDTSLQEFDAQAHDGFGKTTCFVLGILSRVDPKQQVPQALCICPTRELVIQNLEVLKKMRKYTGISLRAIPEYSDNPIHVPINKRPPITSQDGFKDDSMRIMNDIKRSSPKCQVLLFSAIFSQRVKDFCTKAIQDYNQLFVKKEELSLASVKHYKVRCPDESDKVKVVVDKAMELGEKLGQTIIFVRTRNSASNLHDELVKWDRDKIVKEFKDGLTHVLISTDVLARGFDQSQPDCEVYLHRVRRAGRFGRK
ncbi:DEAD-box ATP-dependent RNA helicase 38, partial [Bienertia sinuspersici]